MTHTHQDTQSDRRARATLRWRTVDIIVAAVLGVSFGIVFFAWNNLWASTTWMFAAFPPAQAILYGMWFLPGVLSGLVIRKPGAAVFASTVAATVSVFFGAPGPLQIILYGFGQGLLAEVVFAACRYRRWSLSIALLAGAVAGIGPGILDPIQWYPTWSSTFKAAWLVLVVVSGVLVAGLGSWLLVRALRPTGVLAPFASGQERTDR
ncbi:MAG TPA: ECF transporter S component [Actinopolymorphaceae bacterium]